MGKTSKVSTVSSYKRTISHGRRTVSEDPAVPAGAGSAFVPDDKFPGRMRLRTAVGSTLLFAFVNHPRVTDPEVQERYKSHRHDYRDTDLVVNGETYPAVEVQDPEIGIRVRAAAVSGFTVIATVMADQEATDEPVVPWGLAPLLASILSDGPPRNLVELPWHH